MLAPTPSFRPRPDAILRRSPRPAPKDGTISAPATLKGRAYFTPPGSRDTRVIRSGNGSQRGFRSGTRRLAPNQPRSSSHNAKPGPDPDDSLWEQRPGVFRCRPTAVSRHHTDRGLFCTRAAGVSRETPAARYRQPMSAAASRSEPPSHSASVLRQGGTRGQRIHQTREVLITCKLDRDLALLRSSGHLDPGIEGIRQTRRQRRQGRTP